MHHESLPIQNKILEFHHSQMPLTLNKGKALKVTGTEVWNFYLQKHNLIISCSANGIVEFYDAATLLRRKESEPLQLDSLVIAISNAHRDEMIFLGCELGDVHIYNLVSKKAMKMKKKGVCFVAGGIFLNSSYYAFTELEAAKLSIFDLFNRNMINVYSKNKDAISFCELESQKLLITGLEDGCLAVYKTNQLPKMPMINSVQGYQTELGVILTESIAVKKREYLVKNENDKIKILNVNKGRIRLVKVIQTGDVIFGMVCLERYKVIGTIHDTNEVKFWSLMSGKLRMRLKLKNDRAQQMFLMKDKNIIGVVDLSRNEIEMANFNDFEDKFA